MKQRRPFLSLSTFLALLIIYGCAGSKGLTPTYNPAPAIPEGYRARTPIRLGIEPFKDERGKGKLIGEIRTQVVGLSGKEITWDGDIPNYMANTFKETFTQMGYRVEPVSAGQDLILSGEVKEFWIVVDTRDSIRIKVGLKLIEAKGGKVIWKGEVIEASENFPGVMGSTKEGLGRYVSLSMAKLVRKFLLDAHPIVEDRFYRESVIKEYLPKSEEGKKSGLVSITTEPQGAKVYIGDVYYGKSPVELELPEGVHDVSVRLKGFKEVREKVGVRGGTTTPVEFELKSEEEKK
ncbi:MAG: PEGA domain-containing protein [Deltaproteobacteria bacterium]|nr:PEGA domain-containing protein [Deltaproteobacteria bacterium]